MTPVVAGLVCSLLAQSAAPPAAEKLTSGAVAMLVTRTDAESKAVTRRALSDPDPAVRATAARVVSAAPHADLLDALFAALAREQNQRTAAEMIRDLLALGGAGVVQLLEPQVRRNGPPAVLAYASKPSSVLPGASSGHAWFGESPASMSRHCWLSRNGSSRRLKSTVNPSPCACR